MKQSRFPMEFFLCQQPGCPAPAFARRTPESAAETRDVVCPGCGANYNHHARDERGQVRRDEKNQPLPAIIRCEGADQVKHWKRVHFEQEGKFFGVEGSKQRVLIPAWYFNVAWPWLTHGQNCLYLLIWYFCNPLGVAYVGQDMLAFRLSQRMRSAGSANAGRAATVSKMIREMARLSILYEIDDVRWRVPFIRIESRGRSNAYILGAARVPAEARNIRIEVI